MLGLSYSRETSLITVDCTECESALGIAPVAPEYAAQVSQATLSSGYSNWLQRRSATLSVKPAAT